MRLTDLTISISTAVTIMVTMAGTIYWAADNVVLAEDIQKFQTQESIRGDRMWIELLQIKLKNAQTDEDREIIKRQLRITEKNLIKNMEKEQYLSASVAWAGKREYNMGLLSILGLSGNPVETVDAVANGLDGLFTSDDERLTHKEIMEKLRQSPDSAQLAVNAIEAQHRSLFVAGWRPFIGWVCGLALAYQYLLNPVLVWIVTVRADTKADILLPPELDMAIMMPVLLGMLGLGALRTTEKIKKVTK